MYKSVKMTQEATGFFPVRLPPPPHATPSHPILCPWAWKFTVCLPASYTATKDSRFWIQWDGTSLLHEYQFYCKAKKLCNNKPSSEDAKGRYVKHLVATTKAICKRNHLF